MNEMIAYRDAALRVVGKLEEQLGEAALADARDLVESDEAPIGLTVAASLIADHNLTVPMWVIDEIKRLLQAWPEELAELPEYFETHGSASSS